MMDVGELEDVLAHRFVIAGTGSRDFGELNDAEAAARLFHQLQGSLAKHGDDLVVISGGAQGWDAYLANVAQSMNIPYVLCLPNRGYGEYYWGRAGQIDDFNEMLESAEYVEYTMEDVHNTSSLYLKGVHSNFLRNQRMVDLADAFFVFNESSRGTKDCVARIVKAAKPYKILG